MHSCKDLVSAAHSYIEQYFTDVVVSEEFLQLEAWQVVDFIASDRLTVPSEEKVCCFFIYFEACPIYDFNSENHGSLVMMNFMMYFIGVYINMSGQQTLFC